MKKIILRVGSEAELRIFDELMKKYLPQAVYVLPRMVKRPPVEGDKAREFLKDWITGREQRVSFLMRAAKTEGIIWSTVVRVKKSLPVIISREGRNWSWKIEK